MSNKNMVSEIIKKLALFVALITLLVFIGIRVYAAEEAPAPKVALEESSTLLKEVLVDKTAYFTNIRAKIEGELKNYNSFKISEPFRIVLDLWGVKNLFGKKELNVNTSQVKDIKIADQNGKVRILIETPGDKPLPFIVTSEDGDLVVSVGGGKEEKVTSLDRGVTPSARSPEIIGIDLEDFPGKSNVVVTFTGKPAVERKESEGVLVVDFPDARAGENLLRHLDATRFEIPVKVVDADNKNGGVSVKITYDKGSEFDMSSKEGMVVVSFEKMVKPEKGYEVAKYKAVPERPREEVQVSKDAGAQLPFVMVDSVGQKVYRGQRISLDLKGADIHNVLRIIAEVSDLNIITSDEVKGRVTLRLINVPWDQALDIVLKTKGLGAKLEGNVLRIAPLTKLRAEERELLQNIKNKDDLEELVIETIPVNFANVKELEQQISEVMSDRGKIKVDERTNTLIIKDIPKNIENVRSLVMELDTPTPQVLIEARIVEVSTQFTREVGVQWGAAYQNTSDGLFLSGIMDDQGTLFAGVQAPDPSAPTYSVNLPAAVGQGSGGGITFGIIKTNFRLDLAISALENKGNGKVISSPKIVTVNNNKASIQQGVKIPYSTVSASGTQTQFVDATLKLEVTPHITPDNTIIMELIATNDSPDFGASVNGVPSITSREADTQILVKDGETAVIGGILQISRAESVDAVPWFHQIPLLGWLFKKESVQNDNTELILFITPKIVEHGKKI